MTTRMQTFLRLGAAFAAFAALTACSDASADTQPFSRHVAIRTIFRIDANNNVIVTPGTEMEALRACVGLLQRPPLVESLPWHDGKCLTFDRRHPAIIGKCGDGPYDSPDALKRFAEQQQQSDELIGLGPVEH